MSSAKHKPIDYDAPIKSDKWQNYWMFSHEGNRYKAISNDVFDTEKSAIIQSNIERERGKINGFLFRGSSNETILPGKAFKAVFQIPVK